jgi:predicted nuclease of predicted toxin-antitoxin system
MKLAELTFLADSSVHPATVEFLREQKLDVATIAELGLDAATDSVLLAKANETNRVILTHDRDFEPAATPSGKPNPGIIYLRPSSARPSFATGIFKTLLGAKLDFTPPFIAVASRRAGKIRIRSRAL